MATSIVHPRHCAACPYNRGAPIAKITRRINYVYCRVLHVKYLRETTRKLCQIIKMGTISHPIAPKLIKPPEKGSFPMDHLGLCKKYMRDYMRCLRSNQNDSSVCRQESMDYLQCRMENELMTKESMKNLGFADLMPPGEADNKK